MNSVVASRAYGHRHGQPMLLPRCLLDNFTKVRERSSSVCSYLRTGSVLRSRREWRLCWFETELGQ